MTVAGVIGIGDMGSGLARNLIASGHTTWGRDLKPERMAAFRDMGGQCADTSSEVGRQAQYVYVMVMNGSEAKEIILGRDGLVISMNPGGTILLTSTIRPVEAREIGAALAGTGINLIDSPVSGGFPGAQSGTLTMMAAAPDAILDDARPVMDAVSATIHRVGSSPGDGQTVKAVLQSLLGAMFSATFEAAALAAKAVAKRWCPGAGS